MPSMVKLVQSSRPESEYISEWVFSTTNIFIQKFVKFKNDKKNEFTIPEFQYLLLPIIRITSLGGLIEIKYRMFQLIRPKWKQLKLTNYALLLCGRQVIGPEKLPIPLGRKSLTVTSQFDRLASDNFKGDTGYALGWNATEFAWHGHLKGPRWLRYNSVPSERQRQFSAQFGC